MSKKDLFKAAHDEYRKLLDAGEGELQRYIQQGRRATIASRAGGSTFGTQHQRRRAPAPQNIDEAAPGVDGAILVDADAAAAWQVVAAEPSRIEVGDILANIEKVSRRARMITRSEHQKQREQLVAWQEQRWASHGVHVFEPSDLPFWTSKAGVYPECHMDPRCCMEVFRWQCPSRQIAEHVLAEASQEFKDALLRDWADRHKKYLHENIDPLPQIPTQSQSLCISANMCLCSRLTLRLFVGALIRTVKSRAPPRSQLRSAINQGIIVLCVEKTDVAWKRWVFISYINLTTFRAAATCLVWGDRQQKNQRRHCSLHDSLHNVVDLWTHKYIRASTRHVCIRARHVYISTRQCTHIPNRSKSRTRAKTVNANILVAVGVNLNL